MNNWQNSLQPYNINLAAATKPAQRQLNFSTATNFKVDPLCSSFQNFDWDEMRAFCREAQTQPQQDGAAFWLYTLKLVCVFFFHSFVFFKHCSVRSMRRKTIIITWGLGFQYLVSLVLNNVRICFQRFLLCYAVHLDFGQKRKNVIQKFPLTPMVYEKKKKHISRSSQSYAGWKHGPLRFNLRFDMKQLSLGVSMWPVGKATLLCK